MNRTFNEEVKLLWQKEDIDISKLKMGQNISILHSGVTVTKQDVLIAPFVYEIEILENIQ